MKYENPYESKGDRRDHNDDGDALAGIFRALGFTWLLFLFVTWIACIVNQGPGVYQIVDFLLVLSLILSWRGNGR